MRRNSSLESCAQNNHFRLDRRSFGRFSVTQISTRRAVLPLALAGTLASGLIAVAPAQAAAPVAAPQAPAASAAGEEGATLAMSRGTRNRTIALKMVRQRGWSKTQFSCLVKLWNKESRWNHRAANRSSGAYGIPQALPGRKMASAGADWRTNPTTQIKWGLGYIKSRYGTPCKAWSHSVNRGWY